MQNRYAGDVGDFMKLGLLRHLAASRDVGCAGLTIGLNWYLAPDESHNFDGMYIAYLKSSNRQHASLAACDSELMRSLTRVVATERSVRALEMSGALPAGSPTFSEMLDPSQGPTGRLAWHGRALDALGAADVVFADPDNGLCSSVRMPKPVKYARVAELAEYAGREQSLVVYHHADRSAAAETQARRRLDELAAGVGQLPVGAVITRRGSCRFFLVTAADAHQDRLAVALRTYAAKWHAHADLVASGGL